MNQCWRWSWDCYYTPQNFRERRRREVLELERLSGGNTLLTFKLRYPLRRLQYQQLRSSRIPRITIRMPIPAALARETDKSTLVWKPCSRLWWNLRQSSLFTGALWSEQHLPGVFHPTPHQAPVGVQHAYTETEPSLGASQVCVHAAVLSAVGPSTQAPSATGAVAADPSVDWVIFPSGLV